MFKKLIAGAACLVSSLMPVSAADGTMLTSWYGPGFHGRLTANGEYYNQYGYTAAHKTLPFGTKLEVCYEGCVAVRINDRGPFIGARELDLSYRAANAIGLTNSGVDYVSFTYI